MKAKSDEFEQKDAGYRYRQDDLERYYYIKVYDEEDNDPEFDDLSYEQMGFVKDNFERFLNDQEETLECWQNPMSYYGVSR
jgi:hypothetical protein